MKRIQAAFTLVELLVVITLLTILWTIAFVMFDGHIAESRDAARQNDLNEIVNVLEIFQTENGFFPKPSNSVDITYSWSAVAWTQGSFGESAARLVRVFWSSVPKDPKFKNFYTYSVTEKADEFQIASMRETIKEEDALWEAVSFESLFSQSHANSIETALVRWDYNGFMVRARDAGEEYFIATPSIIATDISHPDVIDIITQRKLVYNNFFNLPASYSGFLDLEGGFNFNVSDPLVYAGSSYDLKSEAELLKFSEKLKYIYATTPTESFDKYISVLEKEGLTSLKWFLTRKFKIVFRSYFNCKDILDDGLADGDKMYTIDPDGPWGADPYEVYCDMTTDGGWWTRVGDNHIENADFSGKLGWSWAVSYPSTENEIVTLSTPVDGNTKALHQTGNYSSHYKIWFDDPSLLKPWYELRLTTWRSDYGSGASNAGVTNTKILWGKSSPWTLSGPQFKNFNDKMANPANFGAWGALTNINATVVPMTNNVTTSYLDGGVLFDGYIPSGTSRRWSGGTYIYPYSSAEKLAIDNWVRAGGILVSTNDENSWDPLGEFYAMPTQVYSYHRRDQWVVENVDHPIVNGSIGLWVDLRWKTLYSQYAHSALIGDLQPWDIVLARDARSPNAPTVILRKHGRWHIIITSGDGVFKDMDRGNTFDANDYETVFAAAIMAFAIETAAGINPHEWYVFHNRLYYNDGTFSTNGEDKIVETITVNDGGTDRIWTKEVTRHKIYKIPENFYWYIWLDANNNKDLYFTGMRLELFYR